MGELDRLMLHRLEGLKARIQKAYQDFSFHQVYQALHNFCAVDLSGFYLDVLKDRLYTSAPQSQGRRAAQTVLHRLASAMVRLMAPILSFTAEDVWDHLPGAKAEAESVHLAAFPAPDPAVLDPALAERWEKLLAVRNEVNKALDLARKEKVVGNSLEARLELAAPPELKAFLAEHAAQLALVTMVGELHLVDDLAAPTLASETLAGLKARITLTAHQKCPACWQRRPEVGRNGQEICDACAAALKEAGRA